MLGRRVASVWRLSRETQAGGGWDMRWIVVVLCYCDTIANSYTSFNKLLYVVDTCQANTMYSKFYSPNVIATGSSELGESSYSVSCSSCPKSLLVLLVASHPPCPHPLTLSTTTTTISVRPSLTLTRTMSSNSLKRWVKPLERHYKIL